jgi:hypothetical protein
LLQKQKELEAEDIHHRTEDVLARVGFAAGRVLDRDPRVGGVDVSQIDNIASGGGPTFVAEAKGIGGRG